MSTSALEQALFDALGQRVTGLRGVSGGDINAASCATLQDGSRVFVKAQARAARGFFEREARGLAWLADAGALRTPRVLAHADAQGGAPAFLALEWIDSGARARDHDEQLGRGLAALHRAGAPSFGLDHDNFLATLPQANGPRADWPAFYLEQRLAPLFEQASARGFFDRGQRRVFERVIARLPELCGAS